MSLSHRLFGTHALTCRILRTLLFSEFGSPDMHIPVTVSYSDNKTCATCSFCIVSIHFAIKKKVPREVLWLSGFSKFSRHKLVTPEEIRHAIASIHVSLSSDIPLRPFLNRNVLHTVYYSHYICTKYQLMQCLKYYLSLTSRGFPF